MSDNRYELLAGLWFFCAVPLGLLFLSAATQDGLTIFHFILALTLIGIAVGGTPIMIHLLNNDVSKQEKTKRERIDTMLRDMSDDELLELKQRLSDGDYSDDTILDFIGDDGELVTQKRN